MATNAILPLPYVPPLKEYEHLTEKERMIAGYPYRPLDPELLKERTHARKLVNTFNNSAVEDEEGRGKILKELFHPSCKDKKMFVEPNFRVDYGYNITVGNNLQMNFDCCILDCAKITIGDNCLVAPNVHIYAATHPVDPFHRQDNDDYYELAKPVTIGNNCWIGGQSTICPGVTIGDNVTIGAGSVVAKDVPSNVVVAGNPAKIIRYLPGAVLPPKTSDMKKKSIPSFITLFPSEVDPKEYEHLSEKDRMLAGYPHRIADPELCKDSLVARDICRSLNSIDGEDKGNQREFLVKLLNKNCRYSKISVEQPLKVDYGYNILIGDNFRSRFNFLILDSASIIIGDNCIVGPGVHIYATNHPLDPSHRKDDENYYELAKPIRIGNNVWVGARSIILPGVTIGDNVVIVERSVVTKDVPSNTIAAGNPASVIETLEVD